MCLIAFDWQPTGDKGDKHRLALIANRDEFFERPTSSLHWWNEDFLAGKDLREGGTWMGITRSGRFAALTNYRGPQEKQTGLQSRGHIVANFLRNPANLNEALHELERTQHAYNGFNLICGDINSGELWWLSNRSEHGKASPITPGLHGLSNALLDTPWPKVARAKTALQSALSKTQTSEALTTHLLATLNDAQPARDEDLPSTGVSLQWERALSSLYISPQATSVAGAQPYGTRASSVVLITRDNAYWAEKTHEASGEQQEARCFSWRLLAK
jgi:uncharacterized protein with NRDE domain